VDTKRCARAATISTIDRTAQSARS
jgi:hypothetical protein